MAVSKILMPILLALFIFTSIALADEMPSALTVSAKEKEQMQKELEEYDGL